MCVCTCCTETRAHALRNPGSRKTVRSLGMHLLMNARNPPDRTRCGMRWRMAMIRCLLTTAQQLTGVPEEFKRRFVAIKDRVLGYLHTE